MGTGGGGQGGRGLLEVAQMQGLVGRGGGLGGLLTSSWGSTTGTHLKIRREVSPTVTQRFSLWEDRELGQTDMRGESPL